MYTHKLCAHRLCNHTNCVLTAFSHSLRDDLCRDLASRPPALDSIMQSQHNHQQCTPSSIVIQGILFVWLVTCCGCNTNWLQPQAHSVSNSCMMHMCAMHVALCNAHVCCAHNLHALHNDVPHSRGTCTALHLVMHLTHCMMHLTQCMMHLNAPQHITAPSYRCCVWEPPSLLASWPQIGPIDKALSDTE